MTKQHISYSELKIFTECPHKWKLQYLDGLKGFTGNIYTAFGTAIHAVCEQSALGNLLPEDYAEYFDIAFLEELKGLDEKPVDQRVSRTKPTHLPQGLSCPSRTLSGL